jgi:hypothetical protein
MNNLKMEKFITTYHGGYKSLNINDLKPGIYTTSDINGAMWYINRNLEKNEKAWLTTLSIKYSNPLSLYNKSDFKKYWIPILNNTNIKYTFKEYDDDSYSFESSDIIKNGGYIENNPFDLIYIDEFLMNVINYNYDIIIGYDILINYDIPIYIPLNINNVKILKNDLYF